MAVCKCLTLIAVAFLMPFARLCALCNVLQADMISHPLILPFSLERTDSNLDARVSKDLSRRTGSMNVSLGIRVVRVPNVHETRTKQKDRAGSFVRHIHTTTHIRSPLTEKCCRRQGLIRICLFLIRIAINCLENPDSLMTASIVCYFEV